MNPAAAATLDDALEAAFRALDEGARDPRSPFHTPALATLGQDGTPQLRCVVLRGFDPATRSLSFHTDRRSAKAAELAADPRAAMHGHDAAARMQLRLAGRAMLHVDDAIADAAWAASRETSRMLYAASLPPGTPVPAPLPPPDDPEIGRGHFAAVVLHFDRLDWLLLDAAGHRRARFTWEDGAMSASWLVP